MTGSLQAAAGGGDPPAGLRPSNGDRYGHGGGEASAVPTSAGGEASAVLTLADTGVDALRDLLATQALQLVLVDDGAPIPGSYWASPRPG